MANNSIKLLFTAILLLCGLSGSIAAQENGFYLNIDSLNTDEQNILLGIDMLSNDIGLNNSINISLEYNAGTVYDPDDDGTETAAGVIDFSVNNTGFDWAPDEGNLCTVWEIHSVDAAASNSVCYGSADCCSFMGLVSSRGVWNEVFYLAYGDHGSTQNNMISAQVIYADYSLSASAPYSSIYHSEWQSLPAAFYANDTDAPIISFNISNNSVFTGTEKILPLKISSDEFGRISYSLNSEIFSGFIDLGDDKEETLNLTVKEGGNILAVNASDMSNNSALHEIRFVFENQPSCSDAVRNGNEDGIDCGGSCQACIAFSVYTTKQSYNLTENVRLTVVARINSTVDVTVTRQNEAAYRGTFLPLFTGAPIAETRLLENTTNAGNYTVNAIMKYLNITERKNASFEVLAPASSPLSVMINANKTSIIENEPILFTASVSGNTGAVSYKWDFQNDGIADSTASSAVYTYALNGTYTVNLTVTDSSWNQTDIETISVKRVHNITVIAKENETSGLMQDAEIDFDGERKNTTSDGTAVFAATSGEYRITARKPGYSTFSNRTEIEGNAVIEIYLGRVDDGDIPSIQLVSPGDNSILQDQNVIFRYTTSDNSPISCSLYIKPETGAWEEKGSSSSVQNNAESSFSLTESEGNYQWYIKCADRYGNSDSSSVYSFAIDNSDEEELILESEIPGYGQLNSEIDSALSELENLGSAEKEAAEAMQLKKTIEKSKTALERASRDLQSLKWRRLNETEFEKEKQSILDKVQALRGETPKSIRMIDKSEFVKYPSKQDISDALSIVINSTSLKFSKKELSNLASDNYKLQSLITVTTKFSIVEIGYISGNAETVTLIQKTISAEKELGEFSFFEIIPKEIAEDIREVTMLADHEVVQKDPVVKIDISKIQEFSYYLKKSITAQDAEKIKSVLLSKNIRKQNKNAITGLVSLDAFSSGFIETLNMRLILEFIIIVVLLAVFLYYQFGDSESMSLMFNKELKEKISEINYLIGKSIDYLHHSKYDEAKLLYKEINSLFRELPSGLRSRFYGRILDIHARIDFIYMDSILGEAAAALDNGDRTTAIDIYSKISLLYVTLPKEYKSVIHGKCAELHEKISAG